MLDRIFPSQFDNHYRGRRLALWLLYPTTLLNLLIGLSVILSPDSKAQSADGIPLDTFGAAGAQAVIGVCALLGLAMVFMSLLHLLALTRYRAMVPLMYVLIVANHLGHRAVGAFKPIVSVTGAPGDYVTLALITASVAGLLLSVTGPGWAAARLTSSPMAGGSGA